MSNCPLCGSEALMMFVSISCGNQQCQNFDPNYVPPTPKYDFKVGDKIQFIINSYSKDADWLGFEEWRKKRIKSAKSSGKLTFSCNNRDAIKEIDEKWACSEDWGELWFPLSAVKKFEEA